MNSQLIPLNRIRNKYLITFELVNRSGLRIGTSSDSIDPSEPDNAVIKSNGIPFIPGTSLKGVFRSAFESLYSDSKCEWCDKTATKENKKEFEKRMIESTLNICDTCLLFGNGFIRGRLYFTDAYPKNPSDIAISIRDGVMIDRDFESAAEKKKYDYEVIEPGAIFDVRISAINVEESQLEKIKEIANLISLGIVRLGGGKSRGLGFCEVRNFDIKSE